MIPSGVEDFDPEMPFSFGYGRANPVSVNFEVRQKGIIENNLFGI
jgi:hypothetical protein